MASIEVLKSSKIEELKISDSKGEFEGFATTYGNYDRVNDVIEKGAFDEYLSENKKTMLLYGHDTGISNILGEAELIPHQNGIYAKAQADLDLPNGGTAYKLVKKGILNSFSIRFETDSYTYNDKGGRTFKKAYIKELSLVPYPANPQALITAVKSASRENIKTVRDFEAFLRDSGFSKDDAVKLATSFKLITKEDQRDFDYSELLNSIKKNTNILKEIIK